MNKGVENINKYVLKLRDYFVDRLKELKDIIIYNKKSESGIILFNKENIFAEDLSAYLNKYSICIRSGNHCSKLLKNEIGVKNTCRVSLYFYNTYDEVDRFIEVIKNPKILEEII